ncbi:putative non-repetitive/WGA-negative nucleoporin C-terminal [Lyophyllum shimeji]|uniref:Non-repetitive/WGA-negative nucleoporin C-terminal n=1 Tax=Lyophyllum shimeji TaxID=47721 RepID=A0A9P3PFG9_LYOSH|nr:putative non-repetitive/WGA-negative nucleoporin C-terminal [Lyophyllum shimeji]
MATFSPSPAPRRSTRNRATAASPPRRIKVTGNVSSATTSRRATPVRQFERTRPTDNASVLSGMDVDEGGSTLSERINLRTGGETLFAKSDQLAVSFHAPLPLEVKQVLKNADFFREPYTGDVDTVAGFALVASARTCFVWQYAQALKGTPTCYIFACPRDPEQQHPPFHALIPYTTAREPGLILLSHDGTVRYWDSIGIGLAGGDHYATTKLDISAGESVTNLVRSDSQTYVASTTAGNLFRLTLTLSGGQHQLTSRLFARPSQPLSLSRLLPSIFSSAATPSVSTGVSRNISALAFGARTPTGGKEIWALVDTRVQRWSMSPEGWEELLSEGDISGILSSAIRTTFGARVDEDDKQVDLELLDLAVDDDKLVVLLSYAGIEDESSMALDGMAVRRIYALAHISFLNDDFKVLTVRSVPYQSTFSSGAPMHPRIKLVMDGALISVQFGDAVALCARDVDYRERLELKAATDRTLGVGVSQDDGPLLVLTAAMMMKVTINLDKVLAYDFEHGEAKLVKSAMTQAILFGGLPENPLQFSLPPDVDEESLMQGAEQLSQAVLESDPEVVQKNHDLTAQLTERKERLSWLIRFINDNAALVKMSHQSRQKLATDAEKLFASYQLWTRHNELLATNPTHSVLNDAVYAYMEEIGQGHYEDVMRAFFRFRVADIGLLIRKIGEAAAQAARLTGRDMIEFLPEANRALLTVLDSALDYREYNLGVYGVELPMIKPWTSRPAVVDVLLGLFDATAKAVDVPSRENEANRNAEPNTQLPELAATLFACIQERLDWLGSPVAASEPGAERDRDELAKKFDMLRPEVLETLRRNGHAGAAFSLAEKYRDFAGLAALCHRENIYPPQDNPNALRIQAYTERFKDEFTTELYRWYIQHGELRVMFSHDDSHRAYMDRFFDENPNTSISWIDDLGKARYGAAATSLLKEAEQSSNLEAKHLMLSVGKLSHLAQLHEANATVDNAVLDAFHDELDFVSVHEALLQEFKSALATVRGRQSLDKQIDIIVKATASKLSDRKALTQIFKDFVRALLQGRALSIEDAIDVLTLKDNTTSLEDYATALQLLARSKDLPETRKASAFRTIWRRIYIHDDWDSIRRTANISDAELNARFRSTALYRTFCSILPSEHRPPGFETLPDVALMTPTLSEIASRWPGLSQEQIEALVQDYNLECDQLGELDLNDVYHRVRELALHDVVWQAEA